MYRQKPSYLNLIAVSVVNYLVSLWLKIFTAGISRPHFDFGFWFLIQVQNVGLQFCLDSKPKSHQNAKSLAGSARQGSEAIFFSIGGWRIFPCISSRRNGLKDMWF